MTTPSESVLEQQARQDRLDAAYAAAGRHDPGHPDHGLYTGLMAPAPEPAAPISFAEAEPLAVVVFEAVDKFLLEQGCDTQSIDYIAVQEACLCLAEVALAEAKAVEAA